MVFLKKWRPREVTRIHTMAPFSYNKRLPLQWLILFKKWLPSKTKKTNYRDPLMAPIPKHVAPFQAYTFVEVFPVNPDTHQMERG